LPWSEEEDEQLLELSQEMTFKEIADESLMSRTYESIRIRASKLKIKSPYDPAIMSDETKIKISCTER